VAETIGHFVSAPYRATAINQRSTSEGRFAGWGTQDALGAARLGSARNDELLRSAPMPGTNNDGQ